MKKIQFHYVWGLSALAFATLVGVFFVRLLPLQVDVATLEQDVEVRVFGLGTVEARILSNIGFEVPGTLVALHTDQGNRVKQGDVLARLYSDEQKARVAQAKAGLSIAQANLEKAKANADKAQAVFDQRKQTNERRQALLAQQTVSSEAAEEAEMEETVAASELALAGREIEVAEAALEDATARYEYEKVLLDHHVLKSPYDALVVARRKELGSVLNVGEALFTLVDPDTVWALSYVDEALAGGIQVGQRAEVRLRSLPSKVFEGRVARVDIESDRVNEERRVYVKCDRCPETFYLGEQAEVIITTAILEEALLVPETAVANFDGREGTIWTIEDGELARRDVEFGQRTLDARLEVTNGLPPGAHVVTGLQSGLREGRAATAVDGSSQ